MNKLQSCLSLKTLLPLEDTIKCAFISFKTACEQESTCVYTNILLKYFFVFILDCFILCSLWSDGVPLRYATVWLGETL